MPASGGLAGRAVRWGWRYLQGFRAPLRDAPAILMYHRVVEPPWDPWGLAVSPARFREQVAALGKHRTLLPMDELAARLAAGSLPPRATALTFDDGYADNALVAKPILDELAAPATFFVTTGFVRSGNRFWWDELAQWVLASPSGAELDLRVGDARLAAAWPAQDRLPDDLARWRVGHSTKDARRLSYTRLWQALQPMAGGLRDAAMAALGERLGGEQPLAEDPLGIPMSPDILRDAASDRIVLGVHGRSHVPLTALPLPERRVELELARREIAELTGGDPPAGLAYPHGSFDGETRELAAAVGYRWAVTSRSARIDPANFDPLALPRLDPGRRSAGAMLRALRAAGR